MKVKYSASSSSEVYRRPEQARRQIKLCVVIGNFGRNICQTWKRAVCKNGRGQNEQSFVGRSSASNEASETNQVERLASIGGDGGIGNGTGNSGGS